LAPYATSVAIAPRDHAAQQLVLEQRLVEQRRAHVVRLELERPRFLVLVAAVHGPSHARAGYELVVRQLAEVPEPRVRLVHQLRSHRRHFDRVPQLPESLVACAHQSPFE
jgi:hypothetical protein